MKKSGYRWMLPGLVLIILGVVLFIVSGYVMGQAIKSEIYFYFGAILMFGGVGCLILADIFLTKYKLKKEKE